MSAVFADSFYYFALLNQTDSHHHKSIAATLSLSGRIVTTDWILTELGDGMSAPANRTAFVNAVAQLRADADVLIVPFSAALRDQGLALFATRPDKEWSLTDCVSFVVMEQEGLTDALTGDRHFEQAGFRALLK
jgi:predicted nucleic acid-binding protein